MAYDSITDVISFSNRYIPDHFRESSSGNQTPLSPSTSGKASPQTDADEPRGRTQDTTPCTATDERSPSPNTQCDPERYVVEDSHEDGWVGPDKIDMLREKAQKDPVFRDQLIELAHYLEEFRPGMLDDTDKIGGIKREARHDWVFRRRLLELIHLLDFHNIQRRKGEWVVHYPQGDRRASAPSSIDVPPSSRPAQPPTLDPRLVARGAIPPPTPDKVEPPSEPSSEAKQFQVKESLEKNPHQPLSGVAGSSTGQASDKGSFFDGGVQLGSGPGQTHPVPQRGGGGDVRKRKRDTLPTDSESSIVPRETRPRPVSLSDDPFSQPHSTLITEAMDMTGEWERVPQPEQPEYTSFPGPAPSETSTQSTSSVGDEAKASVSTSMRPHVSRPESPRATETAEQPVKTELPSGFSAGGLITVPDAPTHPVWGTCPGPIGSSQGSGSAGRDGIPSLSDSSQHSSSENRPDCVRRYSRPINVPSPVPEATRAGQYAPPPQWDNPPPNDRSPTPPPPELVTGRRPAGNPLGDELNQPTATQIWALPISKCAFCEGAMEEGYFSRLDIPPNVNTLLNGEPKLYPEKVDRGGRPAQAAQVWYRTETRQPFGPLMVICEECKSWFHYRCAAAYTKHGPPGDFKCPRCPAHWGTRSPPLDI